MAGIRANVLLQTPDASSPLTGNSLLASPAPSSSRLGIRRVTGAETPLVSSAAVGGGALAGEDMVIETPRRVVFGEPMAAEFNHGSPSNRLTPMPSRDAKVRFDRRVLTSGMSRWMHHSRLTRFAHHLFSCSCSSIDIRNGHCSLWFTHYAPLAIESHAWEHLSLALSLSLFITFFVAVRMMIYASRGLCPVEPQGRVHNRSKC